MDIKFTSKEILYVYGHLRKKSRQLSEYKNDPNFPIDTSNLGEEIELITSIIDKLRDACPEISVFDKYKY